MPELRIATLELVPGVDPQLAVVLVGTIALTALSMLGLGIGTIIAKKPLAGSCGGLACGRACLRGAPCPSRGVEDSAKGPSGP